MIMETRMIMMMTATDDDDAVNKYAISINYSKKNKNRRYKR